MALLLPLSLHSLPPGGAPFSDTILQQPVPGAQRGVDPEGWRNGRLCTVGAANGTNATAALQGAIDACGDLQGGGTVLVPEGLVLYTASLFLRSNLTLRVEGTLVGTATGSGRTAASTGDAPIVYTRRNSLMTDAHAGLLNGGRCLRKKAPLVGWDDCAEWSKLSNVVIEGGGTLDADGSDWYEVWGKRKGVDQNQRPMMLDLLWVDGLTIRDMKIRRPGYWTVHPTFCNNVRVERNSIVTTGTNTDGCDPDSAWNVYIGHNLFSTGDDCIAIKAGRDWSGLMVNISTQNVLAERNTFLSGHGVSIGSETSGWVRNVTIRDSKVDGTNLAVRIKSMRGRGGGVEDVLYQNLTGSTKAGIQLTLNYHSGVPPTNATATPSLRRITIRDVVLKTKQFLTCEGLSDSEVEDIVLDNVTVTGSDKQDCNHCKIRATRTSPAPKCKAD